MEYHNRSGSNCFIQSNGSEPENLSHKSKRQECQPREEALMKDSRAFTSSQRLASSFYTLLERPDADITAIPVVRSEKFPTSSNRDIPVSVIELVYGRKEAGVETPSKHLNRESEPLSSSNKALEPRTDRGPSEGLETHVFQRTIPKDKILVEKPKNFVRGQEERVGTKEGKQASGISSSLQKQNKVSESAKQGKESPKEQ
ncbi:hypothetical protein O181_003090 [Austropuccinia psidii MF-1]|uniref:Uncharacterized protein n=1 Tax=Austropuccinia psidii MF-1 TaxID=1389203 RepID=A0A9Q3GDI7_9BASI|nr:hypothetical protein [Austropuccinia psidii MF-1]